MGLCEQLVDYKQLVDCFEMSRTMLNECYVSGSLPDCPGGDVAPLAAVSVVATGH